MVRKLMAFVIGTALAQPATAAQNASAPVLLAPISGWQVSERPDDCVLSRKFGADGHEALLQFTNYTLGNNFRTLLATGDYKIGKSPPRIAFLPGGEPKTIENAALGRLKDGRNAIIFDASVLVGTKDDPVTTYEAKGEVDEEPGPAQTIFDARAVAVDRFFLGDTFDHDLVLQTGSMQAPLLAMRECTDRIARKLGLEPDALRTLSKRAIPIDQMKWARSIQQDYPVSMLRAGQNAELRMRIIVDATGKVTGCSALPERQPAVAVETACKHTYNVNFTPALDANGNPIASIYSTKIAYSLRG